MWDFFLTFDFSLRNSNRKSSNLYSIRFSCLVWRKIVRRGLKEANFLKIWLFFFCNLFTIDVFFCGNFLFFEELKSDYFCDLTFVVLLDWIVNCELWIATMSRVYVGNLDPRVTERDLEDEFRMYGVLRRWAFNWHSFRSLPLILAVFKLYRVIPCLVHYICDVLFVCFIFSKIGGFGGVQHSVCVSSLSEICLWEW